LAILKIVQISMRSRHCRIWNLCLWSKQSASWL